MCTNKDKRMVNNPFILYGYESEPYFCDRKEETEQLLWKRKNLYLLNW